MWKAFHLVVLLSLICSGSDWTPHTCPCPTTPGLVCEWQPQFIVQRHFMARVVRVIDGDTIDVEVYLGLDVWKQERLRIRGIDAWEVRGEEKERGLAAKAYVEAWVDALGEDKIAILETDQDRGKYGRLIADLIECGNSLAEDLVRAGHAEVSVY